VIARAPGKVVLSGAYAVLEGAPGIVAAVDRYATANGAEPAGFVTPEVAAALVARGLGPERAPYFDAEALRAEGRKLGLGSSAAILLASLAALEDPALPDAELADRLYLPALDAHRRAQGGGSGIDVAASTYGGVLAVRLAQDGRLGVTRAALPSGAHLEIWAAGEPASTSQFLAKVRELAARDGTRHRRLLEAQGAAAEEAAQALVVEALNEAQAADATQRFLAALARQHAVLLELGDAAGIPIVTPQVAALHGLAQASGAVVLPSGAGGGDIALYAGPAAPTRELVVQAVERGYTPLAVSLGARGVHHATLP
jgi:phosphomevalonate kinase